MKTIKIISVFFLLLNSSFAAIDDYWLKGSDLGISTVYKHKRNQKITASVRKGSRKIRRDKFNEAAFQEKLLAERKRLLAMIGVQDLIIKKQEWKEGKVFLTGEYKDNSGKQVHFVEAHHYHDEGVTQILIAGTEAEISWGDKEVLALLKEFEVEREK
jgi:hypothetical protein